MMMMMTMTRMMTMTTRMMTMWMTALKKTHVSISANRRSSLLCLLILLLGIQHITPLDVDTETYTFAGSSTEAGSTNGDFLSARFTNPTSIAFNSDYSTAVMSDQQACLIRKVNMLTGKVSTLGGSANQCTYLDGSREESRFNQPLGIAYSPDNAFVLAIDQGGRAIRRYTLSDSTWDSVVTESSGVLKGAFDLTIDRYGSFALVSEQISSIIIKFSLEDWSVYSIICGVNGTSGFSDGGGAVNLLQLPAGIIISRDSTYALFTDNNAVRKVILSSGTVRTVVGNGTQGYADGNLTSGAMFNSPGGLCFLSAADELYVAVVDSGNHCLRRVHLSSGNVITLAGNGRAATVDGGKTVAQFNSPLALAMAYVEDTATDDFDDDAVEHLSYALITEQLVIRKVTFLYAAESNSSSEKSTLFQNALFYVILVSSILGGLFIYFMCEYYKERRRGVKYKVVKRRIEIRSKSQDNLRMSNDGDHDGSGIGGGDGNEDDDEEEEEKHDEESPPLGVTDSISSTAGLTACEPPLTVSHNHLLDPPRRKKDILEIERNHANVLEQKVSSPQPTEGDHDGNGHRSSSDYPSSPQPPSSNTPKEKSKVKSKSSKQTLSKKSSKEKTKHVSQFSKDYEEPKVSFWLSGDRDKKKKDKRLDKKTKSGSDKSKSSGGSNSDISNKVNHSSGSGSTRNLMRAMVTTTTASATEGDSNSTEPVRNLELQREKFEERKRQKLLQERDRLEKIALSKPNST